MNPLLKKKVFVQIGTFDGNDEFRELVFQYEPEKIVLVEPYEPMREIIFKNYEGIKNVFIESVAITEVNKGLVQLVHPAKTARNGGTFYNKCFSLLPMNDWGNHFKSIEVPSMSFMELCDKYNLTDIHFLQIDTEGYDAEIIKSIDFAKVSIDVIKYEDWGFPVKSFTRHGKDYIKYGINGMHRVQQILTSLGYTINKEKADYVAEKIIV